MTTGDDGTRPAGFHVKDMSHEQISAWIKDTKGFNDAIGSGEILLAGWETAGDPEYDSKRVLVDDLIEKGVQAEVVEYWRASTSLEYELSPRARMQVIHQKVKEYNEADAADAAQRKANDIKAYEDGTQIVAEKNAEVRVAELPDFRKVSTSARLKVVKSYPAIVIGSELHHGVILRAGHTARGLADSKAGKTTNGLEFLRCSLTGEPFFGFFPMVPVGPEESVAFLDPELGDDADGYIRQAMTGCDDPTVDRIRHVDLLAAGGINLRYKADRRWLTEQLEGCGRALFDSVHDMVGNFKPSDDDEVRWLFKTVEEIKRGSGVREVLMNVHMNRAKDERSFGAAAWESKFQSLWSLLKDEPGEDGRARRYFRVEEGRKTGPFPESEVVLKDGRPVLVDIGVGRGGTFTDEDTLAVILAGIAMTKPGVTKITDNHLESFCADHHSKGAKCHTDKRRIVKVAVKALADGLVTNSAFDTASGSPVKISNARGDWQITAAGREAAGL
jgi:hypothetical protein